MDPVTIKGHTAALGAPPGWDAEKHGNCGVLPIREVGNPRAGDGYCESAWKPTAEELAALAAGATVVLRVYGWQPAVALYTEPTE